MEIWRERSVFRVFSRSGHDGQPIDSELGIDEEFDALIRDRRELDEVLESWRYQSTARFSDGDYLGLAETIVAVFVCGGSGVGE